MSEKPRTFGVLVLAGAAALAVAAALISKQDSYRAGSLEQAAVASALAADTSSPMSPASQQSLPLRDAVASKFMVPGYPGTKLPTLSAASAELLSEQSPKSK